MRLAALPTALALVLAAAAPAVASGLPPLGLERGHGSAGLGAFHLAGDVAVADGVTIGGSGYFWLWWNAANVRASWTTWQGPAGAFGLLASGGAGTGYNGGVTPFVQLGPVYETPPAPVRLRLALGSGLWLHPSTLWASGRDTGGAGNYPIHAGDAIVSTGTSYQIGVQPVVEIVVPIGEHLELTLLGNSMAGLYGRW